ncbi:MAG: hypothetical protein GXO54_06720 [Chloroflexi bacterium]|nr:hypothetical protein [Chloroflexota bacterium]
MTTYTVTVVGVGLQGTAAVYDLAAQPDIARIWAVDVRDDALRALQARVPSPKVQPLLASAEDEAALRPALQSSQGLLALTPPAQRAALARWAVAYGLHYVDASYPIPEIFALAEAAAARQVALVPEVGLDPGLDLLLSQRLLVGLDAVHTWHVYGAGIPAPEAAQPPLRYKISWTWEGVLRAYRRPARLVQHGQVIEVPGDALFAPGTCTSVTVPELGPLDAYPNGDVLPYLHDAGLLNQVTHAGRFSLRWPGHCALWYPWVQAGLLREEPVLLDGHAVEPWRCLARLLEPQLHYGPHERDLALVRVEVYGWRDRRPVRRIAQVLDYRDLRTGLFAMQRTVGFTAAIVLAALVRGQIRGRGLLRPLRDVPAAVVLTALAQRGIRVHEVEMPWEPGEAS